MIDSNDDPTSWVYSMRLRDISNEIVELVERIRDGVVSIVTTRIGADSFLRPVPVRGVGSGFIISGNGYIITNNHVVRGLERVDIITPEGEKYIGLVVSTDPMKDLALLKIDRETKPLRLGDSDRIRIGEIVLAIGSPLGLPGPNVTMGVVSATGRNIEGEGVILEDLIQTDAAINPGNSGGPLINLDGEVIGVTTAMIPYAQGISFAIPINSVKRFLQMIVKYGRPIHPRIGVYLMDINPQLKTMYSLPVDHGLLVVRVQYGSPAYLSGIREGDIILKANGVTLKSARELRRIIEDSIDRGSVALEVLKPTGVELVEVGLEI